MQSQRKLQEPGAGNGSPRVSEGVTLVRGRHCVCLSLFPQTELRSPGHWAAMHRSRRYLRHLPGRVPGASDPYVPGEQGWAGPSEAEAGGAAGPTPCITLKCLSLDQTSGFWDSSLGAVWSGVESAGPGLKSQLCLLRAGCWVSSPL